jgi:hypothetical protein
MKIRLTCQTPGYHLKFRLLHILRAIGWTVFWLLALPMAQIAMAQTSSSSDLPGARDFMEYWAASRLLASGGNPYSPEALFSLQQPAGWDGAMPVIMWNPPWTLAFTLPFGLVNYEVGQFFWLLVHVLFILVSSQQLWRIYGFTTTPSHLPWLLALTFVPVIFVLIIGQISPVILAGLTAFLYFERKQKWFAMGACAAVLSVKPHLLYLFWIVFLLWLWQRRQWRVLSGTALVGVSAAVVPLLFDPQIYLQYFALYRIPDIPQPLDWLNPTLRTAIRVFIGPTPAWLQFLPSALAILWVLCYWRRYSQSWQWHERMPLIVLVSVTSSFFAWTYDQVVFLPAIVAAAIQIRQTRIPWHKFWSARGYILINVCHAIQRIFIADELWYFWLAPALLVNYLAFQWEASRL